MVKMNGSAGATALVGMDGFVVGAVRLVDGELHLDVETTAVVVGCPECGVRAVGNGRRHIQVRDLPISGRPTVLCWAKRLWRCREADCPKATWTERVERHVGWGWAGLFGSLMVEMCSGWLMVAVSSG